jgi:hypothetical protein
MSTHPKEILTGRETTSRQKPLVRSFAEDVVG